MLIDRRKVLDSYASNQFSFGCCFYACLFLVNENIMQGTLHNSTPEILAWRKPLFSVFTPLKRVNTQSKQRSCYYSKTVSTHWPSFRTTAYANSFIPGVAPCCAISSYFLSRCRSKEILRKE